MTKSGSRPTGGCVVEQLAVISTFNPSTERSNYTARDWLVEAVKALAT